MKEDNPSHTIQRRIIRNDSIIEFENGQIIFPQIQVTEISDSGDIKTTNTSYSVMVNGERISNSEDIAGICQVENCGTFLTNKTIRYCFFCSKVLCPSCAKWYEREKHILCPDCWKHIRQKRIFAFIIRVLVFPFRKRRSNED